MPFKDVIAVCSEKYTKLINANCRVRILIVMIGGKNSYHCALLMSPLKLKAAVIKNTQKITRA
jgi:hypothetical protein